MAFVRSLHSVCPYSFPLLKELLSSHLGDSSRAISGKLQLNLIKDHLDELRVSTVVVEDNYIDYDYLDAVSALYGECFHEYARYCRRLHLFSHSFNEEDFFGFLCNTHQDRVAFKKNLEEKYVGLIVIRPLPDAILGRVCLNPYGPDGQDESKRHFPVKCTNKVNLFGLDLELKALPFQEQDRVTAQCATSALWSAFHATAAVFNGMLLPPVEITRRAAARMPRGRRIFPSTEGLSIEQIGCAIIGSGLAPYFVNVECPKINQENTPENTPEKKSKILRDGSETLKILKSAIYAHVTAGIPAILGLELISNRDEHVGYHAVTVTGYSLSPGPPEEYSNLISERINKLYVHDDQVGPYARMEFEQTTGDRMWHLSTSWRGRKDTLVYANPTILIFPLHNMMRLPFTIPNEIIRQFDLGLFSLPDYMLPHSFEKREWAIRFTTVNDLRRTILEPESETTRFVYLKKLLTLPLPRFLLHAYAKINDEPLIDIFFDATDIHSGRFVLDIAVHNNTLTVLLREQFEDLFKGPPAEIKRVLDIVREKINGVYDRKTKDYDDPRSCQ